MAEELELEQGSEPLTLRDSLMSAVEQHREPAEETAPIVTETDAQRTERLRDESGKFAKAPEAKPATTEAPVLEAQPQRPPKPSSWKKELEEHWNKLDPEVANYLALREQQYSTGVSTYKQQADQARQLQAAIEPFMPELQRHNIAPDQWIQNLGRAHQTLALGSPEQKHQMFAHLAREYGIDLGALIGQPGQQPAFDPRILQQTIAPLQGEVAQLKQFFEQQQQAVVDKAIKDFEADTTNHPHFSDERVKAKMAELLQSGLAQDLDGAYKLTVRLLDDVWEAQQATQRAQTESQQKAEQAAAAQKARAKVVSVKSATPSGQATTSAAKGRREQIAEAVASLSSGRV